MSAGSVDTLFNVHEHFKLLTFGRSGNLLDDCTFGEAFHADNFYKSIGLHKEDGVIVIETCE